MAIYWRFLRARLLLGSRAPPSFRGFWAGDPPSRYLYPQPCRECLILSLKLALRFSASAKGWDSISLFLTRFGQRATYQGTSLPGSPTPGLPDCAALAQSVMAMSPVLACWAGLSVLPELTEARRGQRSRAVKRRTEPSLRRGLARNGAERTKNRLESLSVSFFWYPRSKMHARRNIRS
jgi:hypothetical protein